LELGVQVAANSALKRGHGHLGEESGGGDGGGGGGGCGGHLDSRVLPLQVLQVSLQVVVGRGSGLQVVVYLAHLLWGGHTVSHTGVTQG